MNEKPKCPTCGGDVLPEDGQFYCAQCRIVVFAPALADQDDRDGNDGLARGTMPVDPERREAGIAPSHCATRMTPDEQGELPIGDYTTPGAYFATHPPGQHFLPGMEPEGIAVPAVMLGLFDRFGGSMLARHAWIEALLSIPVAARDGHVRKIFGAKPLLVREVAVDWFQWEPKHYRERGKKTGRLLVSTLAQLNRIVIPINRRGGYYLPVMIMAVEGWTLDDRIAIHGCIEPAGQVGPSINRAMLRYLRPKSEASYRAYLSLCFEWDRYGATTDAKASPGHKRKLVRHDRPEVKRDGAGYVLDARGRVVTNRRGEPETSPFNRRAVRTGAREPNPARDCYPHYDADDLVRLCFPLKVFDDPAARRAMRMKARRAIEKLESIGGCTIERCGHNPREHLLPWRVMPSGRV